MTAKSLLKEAKKLGVEERVVLAHDIRKSIEEEADASELTEAQMAELLRRQEAYHKNPGRVVSWAAIKRQMRRPKR